MATSALTLHVLHIQHSNFRERESDWPSLGPVSTLVQLAVLREACYLCSRKGLSDDLREGCGHSLTLKGAKERK